MAVSVIYGLTKTPGETKSSRGGPHQAQGGAQVQGIVIGTFQTSDGDAVGAWKTHGKFMENQRKTMGKLWRYTMGT